MASKQHNNLGRQAEPGADNLANDKWMPGAKGKTADGGPLDHTYPQGLAMQQSGQGRDTMEAPDVQRQDGRPAARPGSMQGALSGGSGTVQGITDSHQRQMEAKSAAYGILEEPLGRRPSDTGVKLSQQRGAGAMLGGSMQAAAPGATSGGGMLGPQGAPAGLDAGPAGGNRRQQSSLYVSDNSNRGGGMPGPQQASGANAQEARHGNTQLGVPGSHAPVNQQADAGGVHASNDLAGGLPRSPGNSGAAALPGGTRADGEPPAHDSNDAAGGYPRSPGYANRLSGDQNMDDDTGFKRKP